MDLKASFDRGYGKASGRMDKRKAVVENVKKSLKYLRDWAGTKEARTTIVPGIADTKSSIRKISKEVAAARFGRYLLQQFRPEKTLDAAYMKKRSPPYELMHDLGTEAKRYLPGCRVYTVTSENGILEVKA
jgi:pyruvate-formate lyase-activating enzyme